MIEILDFYADWCHPCHVMHPVIEELKKELQGKAKITVIDVDKEPDQASKYSVLSIPTYVVLKDGKEIDRMMGVTPKQKFIALINAHG